MKWIVLAMLCISCSISDINTQESDYVQSRWQIIESATLKKWSKENVISKLGKPQGVYKHPKRKQHTAWVYYQKETGFQEWTFTFNSMGKIESVLYMPKDPHRSDFAIDKIMSRWKHLNCIHKKKQILMPGLIKEAKFIGCDNDKRVAKYNRYKQVESITVSNNTILVDY